MIQPLLHHTIERDIIAKCRDLVRNNMGDTGFENPLTRQFTTHPTKLSQFVGTAMIPKATLWPPKRGTAVDEIDRQIFKEMSDAARADASLAAFDPVLKELEKTRSAKQSEYEWVDNGRGKKVLVKRGAFWCDTTQTHWKVRVP